MDGRQPLPTLLSHALVAFTIEFDNEFEHQVPHRTTNHGSTTRSHPVPWLVSMVMWSNFMRFIDEEGTTFRELQHRLRMPAKRPAQLVDAPGGVVGLPRRRAQREWLPSHSQGLKGNGDLANAG